MKTISMTAYNRPKYLKNTLEGLSKNNPKDWHFYISVDPSDKIKEIANILNKDYGFASIHVVVNEKRKDHRRNQHDAIELAFRFGSSFNLHMDDDLFIGADALSLASFYERTFKSDPLSFGSYGLFNYASNPEQPDRLLIRPKTFTGLGWCIFRENWEAFFDPNWFKDNYAKRFGHYGWDWNIAGFFNEYNINEIFPAFSRTNHAGREQGTCCNEIFYDKTFPKIIYNTDLIIKDFYYE